MEETLLYRKTLGCLLGGNIGDAMGTPTEGMDYRDIEKHFGWVAGFTGDGTDDTVLRDLLAEALIRTGGYATLDDWAAVWLERWDAIFGPKRDKFYISVIHTAHKLRRFAVPRLAALGNLPSSSSAMCIAPVGIINACHPAQAALQAYNLAGLIHVQDVGFCQDGAAAIAAAVAEAMKPQADVESVLRAASAAIIPISGREMHERVQRALNLAAECDDYRAFRSAVYNDAAAYFCTIGCDSRETVPLALALFRLARGNVEACVTYAANFGRDTDTIGAMAGAVSGALRAVDGVRTDWREELVRAANGVAELATRLAQTALAKHRQEQAARAEFDAIACRT